ncbi:cob(I)yrinic acid a,c-diamide adenosyltransferase [Pseudomonas syringae]|uniref:cob(I)yrinic acid a,c-diamide adenosyltransferase n=1 Tax=Pseudomonas syringae TaxID=317 RepID=UPI0011D0BE96|nr:cob(I)yrinic acid a,c-diamide adenosyltransferase [Pseudomonas syringae]
MKNKMKVSTKTGDSGTTGLYSGERVSKTDPCIDCIGSLDELISSMGLARSLDANTERAGFIKKLQQLIFVVSAEVATLGGKKSRLKDLISGEHIADVERTILHLETSYDFFSDWYIPGTSNLAANYDFARTICRRAERSLVLVNTTHTIRKETLCFINRLSDLLWLYSRQVEHDASLQEESRLRTSKKENLLS